MASLEPFLEILKRPTAFAMILEMINLLGPVSIAFLLGLMVGWVWKPRWVSLGNCKFEFSAPSSPSALVPSPIKVFGSPHSSESSKVKNPAFGSSVLDNGLQKDQISSLAIDNSFCSSSDSREESNALVTDEDLQHLYHLVARKDGGPPWKHMMDRTTQMMAFQAWERDPEIGPTQYCSRTVYEDATPELLRDFFWDDEFRLKWDDMLVHSATLQEYPTTGIMTTHWIRKFPFFCSDREYIFVRRMWESERSYYCVTKAIPCDSIPRKDKPRRVDLYYSSWFIQAAESSKGNERLPACEVILFHHEDMGIPREITKFGIRHGMWGAARNVERGVRAYQKHRASGAPPSHHAIMAQVYTKIDPNNLKITEDEEEDSSETQLLPSTVEKPKGVNIPKLLIIGGAVAIFCSLDQGLFTKTLVFGVAKRFGNIGRRQYPRPN